MVLLHTNPEDPKDTRIYKEKVKAWNMRNVRNMVINKKTINIETFTIAFVN